MRQGGVLKYSSLLLLAAAAPLVFSVGGSTGSGNNAGRGLSGLPCTSLSTCTADITGVVDNGAGASLVATAAGVSTKTAVADGAGAYIFPSLPPGTYAIGPSGAEAASFQYLPSSVSVTLSGNGATAIAPRMARRVPQPPPPAWFPQCTKVDVGNRFTLISAPARSAPTSSADLDTELNVDRNTTTASFAASLGIGDLATYGPSAATPAAFSMASSNVTKSGNVTGAAICSGAGYTRYTTGPSKTPTFCKLVVARGLYGSFSLESQPGRRIGGLCSGTFIQDPSGQKRLLFLTAAHCVMWGRDEYIDIAASYVQCNQDPNAKDATFKIVAAAFSSIDQTYLADLKAFLLITPYDGAVLQLQALADTNLAYAQPFAVAAITDQGFQQSSPTYASGYPEPSPDAAVGNSVEGCNATNLNPVNAYRYLSTTATPLLASPGILALQKIDGCQGNSGGPLIDEKACVVYGVLSAVSANCSASISNNIYSRIVADATTPGVNLPAMIDALKFGQTVLLPTPNLPRSPLVDVVATANIGYTYSDIAVSTDGLGTFVSTTGVIVATEVQFVASAVSADGKRVVAVDMGGQNSGPGGYLYISNDYGNTYTNIAQAGKRYWSDVAMSPDGQAILASAVLNAATANNPSGLGSLHFSDNGGLTFQDLSGLAFTKTPYSFWSSVALTEYYAYAAEFASFDGPAIVGGNVFRAPVVANTPLSSQWKCLIQGTSKCPIPGVTIPGLPASTYYINSISAAYSTLGGSGTVVASTANQGSGSDIYISTTNGDNLLAGKQNMQGLAGAPSSWASVSTNAFGGVIAAVDSANGYVWTATSPDVAQQLPVSGIPWKRRDAAGVRNWSTVVVSANGNRIAAAVGWPLFPINGQPDTKKGYIYSSGDFGASWSERTDGGLQSYRSLSMRLLIGV